MKRVFVAVIFLVFFLGLTSASSITYEIVGKKVLVRGNFYNETLGFNVPQDVLDVETKTNYSIVDGFFKISSEGNFTFNYITDGYLDGSGYFVLSDMPPSDLLRVYLPEGSYLSTRGDFVFPKGYLSHSDGYRIYLEWENLTNEDLLVLYETPANYFSFVYLFVIVILIIVLSYVFYNYFKAKKRLEKIKDKSAELNKKFREIKDNIVVHNLFGDEKRIVEYLLSQKNNECWTKEVVRDLDIKKVKLSRKLRSLEEKGILEKIPYGNENRIRLIK